MLKCVTNENIENVNIEARKKRKKNHKNSKKPNFNCLFILFSISTHFFISTNVTSGYCKTDTSPTCEAWKPTVWAVFTTITLFGVFWNMIPYMQLCIRSVPFNLRSQAIAWYSVIARALGSIPGPIFFGAILDTSCVVWEPEEVDSCNPPDKLTAGSCMLFNSRGTSYSWLGMMLITRVLNGLLLMLMHHFAKQRRDQEMKGNGEIELDVNDKIKNSNGTENSKEKTGNVNSSFK